MKYAYIMLASLSKQLLDVNISEMASAKLLTAVNHALVIMNSGQLYRAYIVIHLLVVSMEN